MILSRLKNAIREQNWFAVVLEVCIVVVGVFLGFQLNNWNETRKENARAEVFSASLLQDLQYEAWVFQFVHDYYVEVRASAERALAALNGESELADEQFLISAYRASQWKLHERRRTTHDELLATGEIRLIRDEQLRRTAISVFSRTTLELVSQRASHSDYRILFRQVAPVNVQRALLENCGDRTVEPGDFSHTIGSLDYECSLGLPASEIEAAAATLKAEESMLPALQLRFADLETAIVGLGVGKADLRQSLRDLGSDTL